MLEFMPRVRVYLGCSLDGCIGGPNGDISFLSEFTPEPNAEPDLGLGFEAFLEQIGALLMGRNTYEIAAAHTGRWPYGARPVLVAATV